MESSPSPNMPGQDWQGIAQVVAISNELGVYTEVDDMLHHAVRLARDRLKLERVSIYLYDRKKRRMRGTFGTGPSGETVDERWHSHVVDDCETLRQLVGQGKLWKYFEDVELQVLWPHRKLTVGRGWNTATPLLAAGKVVGVMYADAALSGSAFDAERQAHAALLCSSLATLIHSKCPALTSESSAGAGQPTRMVRRLLATLEQDAVVNTKEIADELGVSSGHLARLFRSELGMSLVEYRNRHRLRRFFDQVEQGETNLSNAAVAAGFGSYAQFHRVYRRSFGGTPRDLISPTLPAK